MKAGTGKKREVEDAHMDAHIEIPIFFAPGQILHVDAAQVKDTAFTPVGLVAGLHLNVDFSVAVQVYFDVQDTFFAARGFPLLDGICDVHRADIGFFQMQKRHKKAFTDFRLFEYPVKGVVIGQTNGNRIGAFSFSAEPFFFRKCS